MVNWRSVVRTLVHLVHWREERREERREESAVGTFVHSTHERQHPVMNSQLKKREESKTFHQVLSVL